MEIITNNAEIYPNGHYEVIVSTGNEISSVSINNNQLKEIINLIGEDRILDEIGEDRVINYFALELKNEE